MTETDPLTPDATPVEPLLAPREGFAGPVTDPVDMIDLAARLARGTGPVALDAERASGFRYSSRAYLVQLRRADVGTVLLDPIALGDLEPLAAPLAETEWLLHAASQDLPCLTEIGLRPQRLFDTELAGRLLGLPRVGLGPLVEQMLGLRLEKGHGAADWSQRPLPADWLTYAALDVELLEELRDLLGAELERQGKTEFARQEFDAVLSAPPPAPRVDPWRRTSGLHKIRQRRQLAIVRELWHARDELASARDVSPHRVLPDGAIINAAVSVPATVSQLVALPVFTGRMQRRHAQRWFAAIDRAKALPDSELPPPSLETDGPPPVNRWKDKDPEAATRLAAAREGMTALAETWTMPLENLLSPDLLRRVCWAPPPAAELPERLAAGRARPWQIELALPILTAALYS